jgi:hypothetical protein
MTAMYKHGSVWYGTDYGQYHQATSIITQEPKTSVVLPEASDIASGVDLNARLWRSGGGSQVLSWGVWEEHGGCVWMRGV